MRDRITLTIFCAAVIALAAWCLIFDWIPQAVRLAERRVAQEMALEEVRK